MKKEREFIISSEELKRNQERVLKAEAEARRIEAEEKKEFQINVIVACVLLIVMFICVAFIFKTNTDGVASCIEAGNSASFCNAELLR
ncbi:MAG: hypothetical protein J6Q96_01140 [Bacteroidales bacterium]|nr:hypothetical protein [Bacteroidales bacterium]